MCSIQQIRVPLLILCVMHLYKLREELVAKCFRDIAHVELVVVLMIMMMMCSLLGARQRVLPRDLFVRS
jgi:hypothetical protein